MNETINDEIADFFSWYVLYDIPIESVFLDFTNRNIQLNIKDCDAAQNSVELRLVLKNVSKFLFEYPHDKFLFSVKAIHRIKFEMLLKKYYELTLLLDMERIEDEVEFTVGEMLIGFEDLEIIGGLSREAMAYKWQNED
jgi:hypothetical protein